MKVLLLVADLAYRVACHLDQRFIRDRGRTADFTGEHHAVRCDQRLDAAAGLWLSGQESVDDRVGNAVANFVGMPLPHRFAREHVIPVGQRTAFPESVKKTEGSTSALMQSCLVGVKPDFPLGPPGRTEALIPRNSFGAAGQSPCEIEQAAAQSR